MREVLMAFIIILYISYLWIILLAGMSNKKRLVIFITSNFLGLTLESLMFLAHVDRELEAILGVSDGAGAFVLCLFNLQIGAIIGMYMKLGRGRKLD